MKKPICFLALTCVLFGLMLFGCEESLRFEQPQPTDAPELSRIPRALRGTYQEKDSIFLRISKKSIIEYSVGTFKETLEALAKDMADEEEVVFRDSTKNGFTASLEDGSMSFKVKYNSKTGTGSFDFSDTKFSIGPRNIIKSKDGVYYLNIYRKEDTAWILRKLVLTGDKLTTYKVDDPSEIAELEAITEVRKHFQIDGDEKGWKIDPSPEVLDRLFEKYGKKVKEYTRVK